MLLHDPRTPWRRPRTIVLLGLLVALSGLPATAQDLPVDAPEDVLFFLPTPYDVVLTDWNLDARPDLLTASFGGDGLSGSIRLFRNETFGYVETTFAISGRASAVDAGDIDGDGTQDLLYGIDNIGSDQDRVGVVLNRESDLSVVIADSQIDGPEAVHLADIDGDGDLDAVTAEFGSAEVSWHENVDGDGETWTTHRVASGHGAAVDVLGHDVDLDGDLDIVVITFTRLMWLENRLDDNMVWLARTIDDSVPAGRRLAVGDLDGDGRADIVATSVNTPLLAWWDRPAQVIDPWTRRVIANEATSDVVANDIDQDGDLDLLTTRWAIGEAPRLWRNDGTGQFSRQTLTGSYDIPRALAVGDLDLDGDADLAIAGGDSDSLTTIENRTVRSTVFLESIEENRRGTPTWPLAMAAADLDRDGDLDLVSYDADGVLRLRDTFDQVQGTVLATIGDALLGRRALGLGDIDGDSDLDVVLGLDSGLTWFENDGGVFSPVVIAASARSADLRVVDINGDGRADVVDYDQATGFVRGWTNPTGMLGWQVGLMGPFTDYGGLAIADVDRNGLDDIIVSADDRIQWFERLAAIAYQPHLLHDGFAPPHLVAGDFDADGDVDLAGTVPGPNTLRYWVQDALGGWSVRDTDFGAGIEALDAVDIDLDGDLDIVGVGESESAISFTPRTAPDPFPNQAIAFPDLRSRLLAVGDFTGDGYPDTMGAPTNGLPVLSATIPGQFSATFMPMPPGTLPTGEPVPLLEFDLTHQGRTGDQDLRLTSALLTVTIDGQTATAAQIQNLFERIVLRSDGNDAILGENEALNSDSPVTIFVTTPSGDEIVPAPAQPGDVSSGRFRLEVELRPSTTIPEFTLRVGAAYDVAVVDERGNAMIPLPQSRQIRVYAVDSDVLFADGFDAGNTDAWSRNAR